MNSLEKAYSLLKDIGEPELFFNYFEDSLSGEKILSSYVPIINKYIPKLMSTARKYQMTSRWNYRPDYCSHDIYETTNWWWLILYLNKCASISDFNINKITYVVAPSNENLRRLMYIMSFNY